MKEIYFLLLFWSTSAFAQNHQIGLKIGASNYRGDLTESIVSLKETHLGLGAYGQLALSSRIAIKVSGTWATISGDDSNAKSESLRNRNLQFRSRVFEGSLEFVLNPFSDQNKWTPFLSAGIGYFRYNPKAMYNDEWIPLQPLGTEGQSISSGNRPYTLGQVMIPAAIGIDYRLSEKWQIGLELAYRITFTDYLDDISTVYTDSEILLNTNGSLAVALADRSAEVSGDPSMAFPAGSKRGNPDYNDGYGFLVFRFSYIIEQYKNSGSCPRF